MTDLSNNGNETANSYVISKPGDYCFPLVYGNALLNNKPNEKSYTKLGGELQADFYDYMNNIITRPEIPDKIYETKILVWDSSREFISDLRTENDYIKFQVSYVPDDGANYILGVLDWSGKVVWSWHIWLWKGELKDQDVGNGYKVLNVNFGMKGDRAWFYQWGRKDPINPFLRSSHKIINRPAVSIGEAIQSPWAFFIGYNNSYYYDNWVKLEHFINYGNSNCKSFQVNEKVIKTIYDPFPPGYNVPRRDIFVNVSVKVLRKRIIGVEGTDIALPHLGGMIKFTGEWEPLKSNNFYWTSGNWGSDSANMMSVTSRSEFTPCTGYPRYFGLPIRPQKTEI